MTRLTVAVASHERPLRLRWLLNAHEEQTLARDEFEVVVCFDDAGEETARLLAEHPLGVRARRLPPPPGGARARGGARAGRPVPPPNPAPRRGNPPRRAVHRRRLPPAGGLAGP